MRIYKTHVNIHSQLKIYIPTDRLMRRDIIKVVRVFTKKTPSFAFWFGRLHTMMEGGIYLWG